MKTMMLNDKVMRVSDERTSILNEDGWKYVPKSVWKDKIRKETESTRKNKKKSKKKVV